MIPLEFIRTAIARTLKEREFSLISGEKSSPSLPKFGSRLLGLSQSRSSPMLSNFSLKMSINMGMSEQRGSNFQHVSSPPSPRPFDTPLDPTLYENNVATSTGVFETVGTDGKAVKGKDEQEKVNTSTDYIDFAGEATENGCEGARVDTVTESITATISTSRSNLGPDFDVSALDLNALSDILIESQIKISDS